MWQVNCSKAIHHRGDAYEVQAQQCTSVAIRGQRCGRRLCYVAVELQSMLIRCAKRRVDRSGQARHPRLRAGGAARDDAVGPCGGISVALLLRTCNPSKRHRKGSAGSGMRVMSPGRACEWAREGYLGLEMPNMIPGGSREGPAGSGMRVLSPGAPADRTNPCAIS